MSQKAKPEKVPPEEDPWTKPGEVRLRVATTAAGSKDPSKDPICRSREHFLTPKTSTEEEFSSLLSRSPFIGKCLVEGSVVGFVVLSLAVMACLPCSWPGAWEQQAAFIAVTMQVASLLQDITSKQTLCTTQQWLQRAVLAVKALSMLTNATLCVLPTPFVTEVVTGRPNCMLRWAEWCVLSFTMTFMVESIDSRDVRGPVLSAASQSLSTFCGLFLPLCPSLYSWLPTCALSILLYLYIWRRLWMRATAVKKLRETVSPRCYELRSAALALRLLKQCVATWTALVAVWSIDVVARCFFGANPATDWAFIADCAIDVIAKTLYSSVIRERAEAEPINFRKERQQVSEQQVRALWTEAKDILIVSQRTPRGYLTVASPSLASVLGDALAAEWAEGIEHTHAQLASVACDDTRPRCFAPSADGVRQLVSLAWEQRSFECAFSERGGGEGERVFEASSAVVKTIDEGGIILIARDLTDRVRRMEAEKEALSANVARDKDDEVNRFMRHEVKNCVLAALSQLDSMQSGYDEPPGCPCRESSPSTSRLPEQLDNMRAGLNQTLDTVLSQAMVREVVHGIYVARTVAAKVDEVLRVGVYARGPLFPMITSPRQLPAVDIDPQLLRHIHRNAVSNAAKYGKKGGVVTTEIGVKDHWLTLRVLNEPGEGHAAMCEMDPALIFDKGARFHGSRPGLVLDSKGDGAWIMKKCSDCLQGSAAYTFEPRRTTFELRCPAPERLDELELELMPLGSGVWGVGVDDGEFQRLILGGIFEQVGLPAGRVEILGGRADDLESLSDFFVSLMRERLPAHARVLAIVDENLDIEDTSVTISGSHAVQAARERLTPSEESRLLVLIRPANDSANDVMSYLERAHGFLSKAPIESDRKVIKRAFFGRFGVNRSPVATEEASAEPMSPAQTNLMAANKELRKAVRLVDRGRMHWAEMWKWLHRIKGIVATVKSALQGEQLAVATNVIAMIERIRPRTAEGADAPTKEGTKPHDIEGQWMTIKRLLMWLMESTHAAYLSSPTLSSGSPSPAASPFGGGAAAMGASSLSSSVPNSPRHVASRFNVERPAPSPQASLPLTAPSAFEERKAV